MDQSMRESEDRRKTQAGFFSLRRLHGRRRSVRRKEDLQGNSQHLDWYDPRLLLAVLALMALCVADAHNTLQLIHAGAAKEANPIMDYLLQKGTLMFLAGKFGITAICLLVLVACHNYPLLRKFHARHAIYTCLFLYTALVTVQAYASPEGRSALLFIPPDTLEALLR